jgi:hypothetical protein
LTQTAASVPATIWQATACGKRRARFKVGDPGIEVDLDHDRHRQQCDDQRLAQVQPALKAEQAGDLPLAA